MYTRDRFPDTEPEQFAQDKGADGFDEKRHLVTVIQELRREYAICMRVAGNWREFPGAPAEEEPKDWKYALRCIEKLKLAESKLREFDVEWDGEKYVFAPKSS